MRLPMTRMLAPIGLGLLIACGLTRVAGAQVSPGDAGGSYAGKSHSATHDVRIEAFRADERGESRGVNDVVTALNKLRVTRVRIAVDAGG